jgi:hypothetical protein
MELLARAGARGVGLDYSRVSLGVARDALTSRALVLAAAPSLPFRDACFDRVASLGVLGYLSRRDLALALAECGRVLRPDGCLVICTGTPLNRVGALLVGLRSRLRGETHRVGSHLYPVRTYVRELERLGFAVDAKRAWDGAPQTLRARALRPFFASLWIRAQRGGVGKTERAAERHRPLPRTAPMNSPSDEDQGARFSPLFIVGCERSGTTLLRNLLDRHSQMAVLNETFFFNALADLDFETTDRRRLAAQVSERLTALPHFQYQLHDFAEQTGRIVEAGTDKAGLFRAILEHYAFRRGKPRAAEKTPSHLYHAPEILRLLPNAKMICVVRDARDVALSLRKLVDGPLWLQAVRWRRAAQQALRYQRRYPERFRVVRYEDLIGSPRQILGALDRFAGLEYEDSQLDPSIEPDVFWGSQEAFHRGSFEPLNAASVQAWKRTASRQQKWIINAVAADFLRAFGYDDTGLDDCPLPSRLGYRISSTFAVLLHRLSTLHAVRRISRNRARLAGRARSARGRSSRPLR